MNFSYYVLVLFSIMRHPIPHCSIQGDKKVASYYVVQSYSTYKGAVRADAPVQANSINQARKMAERLAKHKAAVVAFMREGNLKSGDFEDPKLIAAYGENLPEEVLEMERI